MPLIHYRSSLIVLAIHRHHRKPPRGNFGPPFQLSLTCTTIVCNDCLLRPLLICRARRWEDSNAESFTTQSNFSKFGDDDDEDSEDDYVSEQWDDALQEYIDSIWIFKVFRSYGFALPFILVPLLIINGPKSFLLALAVPIWQSTFSFALQKMWDGKGKRRTVKNKTRSTSRRVDEFGGKKRVGREGNKKKKSKMGYKSWVEWDDDSSFGGWDKVDNGSEFQVGYPSISRSGQRIGRSQKSSSETSRLRESDTPLLLRLLIAAFPFLSSWTKML